MNIRFEHEGRHYIALFKSGLYSIATIQRFQPSYTRKGPRGRHYVQPCWKKIERTKPDGQASPAFDTLWGEASAQAQIVGMQPWTVVDTTRYDAALQDLILSRHAHKWQAEQAISDLKHDPNMVARIEEGKLHIDGPEWQDLEDAGYSVDGDGVIYDWFDPAGAPSGTIGFATKIDAWMHCMSTARRGGDHG